MASNHSPPQKAAGVIGHAPLSRSNSPGHAPLSRSDSPGHAPLSRSNSPSHAPLSRSNSPTVSLLRAAKGPSLTGSFSKLPPVIFPEKEAGPHASSSAPFSDTANSVVLKPGRDIQPTIVVHSTKLMGAEDLGLSDVLYQKPPLAQSQVVNTEEWTGPAWNGTNSRLVGLARPIMQQPLLTQPMSPILTPPKTSAIGQTATFARLPLQQNGGTFLISTPTQTSQAQASNHFVEAHILYISNLHPAFTDELLVEFLQSLKLNFQSPPKPKINDRPLSKETAGEVKFSNECSFKAAQNKLNGMDISNFVRERIFNNATIGQEATVIVHGEKKQFIVEQRRNIFAMRKMQRMQYEASMCQRGVFTFQLERHNIQSSQELYELFDGVPDLQKTIEQIRVAETRDKNGKAQKSRGCGHILFPDTAILAQARQYLDKVGCPNTPYTRPMDDAAKLSSKTFLRNPTNVHIKNIPAEFMNSEGRVHLEGLLRTVAASRHPASLAASGSTSEDSLRSLELKENKFGHEGFASFCHQYQAEAVINALDNNYISPEHRQSGCKPLKLEFFEAHETRQARLTAQRKEKSEVVGMQDGSTGSSGSDPSVVLSDGSLIDKARMKKSRKANKRKKMIAGVTHSDSSTSTESCCSTASASSNMVHTPTCHGSSLANSDLSTPMAGSPGNKSDGDSDEAVAAAQLTDKIGQDVIVGQSPRANCWSDSFLSGVLNVSKVYSPVQLFNALQVGVNGEFYDSLLAYACRFAYDNYMALPAGLRAKTNQERFSTSFVRDHVGQSINRPDCFTPGSVDFAVFHASCGHDMQALDAYLLQEISVFCRHLQLKLSGTKFDDVMSAYQTAVAAVGRPEEVESRLAFFDLLKNLAMTKARHVVNRDRSRTKYLHQLFTESAFYKVLEVQETLPLRHPDLLFKATWQANDFKEAIQEHLRTLQYLSMKDLTQQMYSGNHFNRLYATHHIVVKLAMTAQAKFIVCKQTFCRDFLLFLRGRLILPHPDVRPPKKCASILDLPTIAHLSDFAMKAVQTYFDISLQSEKANAGVLSTSALHTVPTVPPTPTSPLLLTCRSPTSRSRSPSTDFLSTGKPMRRRSSTSDMRLATAVNTCRQYPSFSGAPYMLNEASIQEVMDKLTANDVDHWYEELARKAFIHGDAEINADQWHELYDAVLLFASRCALDDYNLNPGLETAGITVHNYVLGFRRQVAARIYYPTYVSLNCKELPDFIGEVLACDGMEYFSTLLASFRSYSLLRRHEVKYDDLLSQYNFYAQACQSGNAEEKTTMEEQIRQKMTAFVTHAMHNAVRNARTRKHVSHELYSEMDVFDCIKKSFSNTDAIFDGLPKPEHELVATARAHIDNYGYLDDTQLLSAVSITNIPEQALCIAHHIILKSALAYAKSQGRVQEGGEEHFCWHLFNFFIQEIQLPRRQVSQQEAYDKTAQLWTNRFFNIPTPQEHLSQLASLSSVLDSVVPPFASEFKGSSSSMDMTQRAYRSRDGRLLSRSSCDSGIERSQVVLGSSLPESSSPIRISMSTSDMNAMHVSGSQSQDSCFADVSDADSSDSSSDQVLFSSLAKAPAEIDHYGAAQSALLNKDAEVLYQIAAEAEKLRPSLDVPHFMRYMQTSLVSKGGVRGLEAYMRKNGLETLQKLVEWEMPLYTDYERKMERQPLIAALVESKASMQGHRVALVRRYVATAGRQLAEDCAAPPLAVASRIERAQLSITPGRVNKILRNFSGSDLDEALFNFVDETLDLESLVDGLERSQSAHRR